MAPSCRLTDEGKPFNSDVIELKLDGCWLEPELELELEPLAGDEAELGTLLVVPVVAFVVALLLLVVAVFVGDKDEAEVCLDRNELRALLAA